MTMILKLLSRIRDLEHHATVTVKDIAEANMLILAYLCGRLRRSALRSPSRAFPYLDYLDEEARRLVVEKIRGRCLAVRREIEQFLTKCLRRYIWLRYFASTPLADTATMLALVAAPPQLAEKTGLDNWVQHFLSRDGGLVARLFQHSLRRKRDLDNLIREMIGGDAVRQRCNNIEDVAKDILEAATLTYLYYATTLENKKPRLLPPRDAEQRPPPLLYVSRLLYVTGVIDALCPDIDKVTWSLLTEKKTASTPRERTHWTKIAERLLNLYLDQEGRCRICHKKLITSSVTKMTLLSILYRHFKTEHPEKISEH